MTTLAELQAQFQSFLLDREGSREQSIEQLTVGSDRLPVDQRLAVYADAYRLRLLEVLADDFPGLKDLIGGDAFDNLGTAYIHAFPSTHPSVRWFGRYLVRFLSEAAGYRDQPALAEMAAFEWAQGEVTDAADSPMMSMEDFGRLASERWPGMRIVFQSALRRLDFHWNVPAVWQAVRADDTPPPLERSDAPVSWLLWRKGIEVHWRSLDDDERYAIDAAWRGATFAETCEGLLARTHDDQVPIRAAGFLKRWVVDELVARIETRDTNRRQP